MLNISIGTSNAAFLNEDGDFDPYYGGFEIQRILTEIALDIQNGYETGTCMDINGNKVGKWTLDI